MHSAKVNPPAPVEGWRDAMELALWGKRPPPGKSLEGMVALALAYGLSRADIRPTDVKFDQHLPGDKPQPRGQRLDHEYDLVEKDHSIVVFEVQSAPDAHYIDRIIKKRRVLQEMHPDKTVQAAIITLAATNSDVKRCEEASIAIIP